MSLLGDLGILSNDLLLGLLGCGLLLLSQAWKEFANISRFASLDVAVEGTDNGVSIIDSERSDISHGFDLGGTLLVLSIGHLNVELVGSGLDGIPSGKSGGEVDVSRHAEISWVDDLVGRRVVQNGLGVDTGLVGEGAKTGDVVVEWNVDLDSLGNQLLNILQLLKLVLALDIVTVGDNHAGHESSEWGDTVALSNTENRGIDVGGTSLKGAVCVGNGASSIVVEMGLDITRDDSTKSADEIVDLSRGSTSDGIGNTDTVDTDLVDGGVDGEEVDQVRAERVLAGEADLNVVRLYEVDNLNGSVGDVGHVLSMGVLHEVGRSANDDIDSINTSLNSDSGIVHMAADVGKNLGRSEHSS